MMKTIEVVVKKGTTTVPPFLYHVRPPEWKRTNHETESYLLVHKGFDVVSEEDDD
jgi:hypothetical protein